MKQPAPAVRKQFQKMYGDRYQGNSEDELDIMAQKEAKNELDDIQFMGTISKSALKEIEDKSEAEIRDGSVHAQRLTKLLTRETRESNQTLIFYFANLIALILSLMIFYGLIIVFCLAMAIHWYDRLVNGD